MLDINITNQQKQYLLYILESGKEQSLPTLSNHFNCSKVNSKKIIDRMVKIGMVYKENNRIFLTDLGRQIADKQLGARDDMAIVLHEGLGIDPEVARELANSMLVEESRGIRHRLISMARFFIRVERRQGDCLSTAEVAEMLGPGEFKTYFVVFQEEVEQDDDAFVPLSMAHRGFYEDATISIDDNKEGSIQLRTKQIEETMNSAVHRAKPKLMIYKDGGKEVIVPIGTYCRLPFRLIKEWHYTGGGVLQASLGLCVVPDVNIEHHHYAKFVFTINLFNLN